MWGARGPGYHSAVIELIRDFITNPFVIGAWLVGAAVSLAVVVHDLRHANAGLESLMKWVWGFTVAYSGVLGLAVYWHAGRPTIPRDSLWRRSVRSVAHCYSGCGAGEITGVFVAVGLLALSNLWVAAITFSLAYVFGLGMTVGPLLQEGEAWGTAWKDGIVSETASITVMEVVAIGTDLWLAGEATMGEPLFWSALVVSLTVGFWAAYPVNVWLVARGVKEGMHDPRTMSDSGQAAPD